MNLFQQLKDEDSFRVIELSSENVKLKHQLDLYKNSHKTEQDRRRVFEQTLAEIKEIAEDTKDKFYDAIHTGGLYDRLEQIIRKINEAKNV